MARDPDVAERHVGRHLDRADVHRERAARREPAAGRRVAQVRRRARDDLERPAVGVDVREGREQLPGVRVPRPGEHLGHRALLRDAAGVHDHDPVARLGDDRQVVGDEDQRQPELGAQVLEQLEDLRLDHDVERRRRLVADDDRRVAGERHRDHRPLAHPARQLVRVAAAARLRDADQLEQLARPLPRRRLRHAQPLLDRLGDLVADALDRVEGVHRALEDDRDLAPAVAPERVLGLRHEVDAHQLDAAADDRRVRRQDPDERQRGRRLAAAGLAGDAERLAVVEPEADAVDGLDRPRLEREVGLEVLDDEERRVRVGLLGERPLMRRRDGHRRRRAFGLSRSSRAPPMSVNARTTRTMQTPGETYHHQAPRPGRAGVLRRPEDLAPRRRERVAEADERERRLGQDRAGEDRARRSRR